MFYYIYKITNLIDGKIYIGVHKTKDMNDGYMGSGKIIKNAINKYGKSNFKKEIIETFSCSEDMYLREKEIVTDDFLAREDTYNLRRGGTGGFDYLNKTGLALRTGCVLSEESRLKISKSKTGSKHTEYTKKILSENNGMKNSEEARKKVSDALTGKEKTDEHKQKISEAIKKWHMERKQNKAAMVFNG